MLIKILSFYILVTISFGNWVLELKEKNITSILPDYPKLQKIYTVQATWGDPYTSEPRTTALDISTDVSWIFDSQTLNTAQTNTFVCNGVCNKINEYCSDDSMGLFFDMTNQFSQNAQLQRCQVAEEEITIQNKNFKNVKIAIPFSLLNANGDTEIFKYIQSSLGLGPGSLSAVTESFFSFVEERVKLEEQSVSLYMSKGNEQIIVGKPQGYFKIGDWQIFQHPDPILYTDSTYAVRCDKIVVRNGHANFLTQNGFIMNNGNQYDQYGFFSSTNNYIVFHSSEILNGVISKINQLSNAMCSLEIGSDHLYECRLSQLPDNRFPDIDFYFFTNTSKKASNKVTLKGQDYVEKIKNANGETVYKMLLMLGINNLQNNNMGVNGPQAIWFGYPMFRSNYISFDYESREVRFAPIFDLQKEPLKLNELYRIVFIIGGCFLIFICFLTLLSILRQVPYQKEDFSPPTLQRQSSIVMIIPPQRQQVFSSLSNEQPRPQVFSSLSNRGPTIFRSGTLSPFKSIQ